MQGEIKLVKQAKIKGIKYIGKEDVYNMEVESHHNFAVNGGLIVHNCLDADRYFVNTVLFDGLEPIDSSTAELLSNAKVY